MFNNNRNELYSLSNQLIEIFVTDVLTKNKVNMDEVREKVSAEQKEKLKRTVEQLQAQVEDLLHSRDSVKTVTEKVQNNEQPASPLREKVVKKQAESNDTN